MNDIRPLLTDALREIIARYPAPQGYYERIVDALLSLPGIAILETEPISEVRPEDDLVCYELGGGDSILYTADNARRLAAALLAAANKAEETT